jgi:hypothetical protein
MTLTIYWRNQSTRTIPGVTAIDIEGSVIVVTTAEGSELLNGVARIVVDADER